MAVPAYYFYAGNGRDLSMHAQLIKKVNYQSAAQLRFEPC
jgi:hypothetical protein